MQFVKSINLDVKCYGLAEIVDLPELWQLQRPLNRSRVFVLFRNSGQSAEIAAENSGPSDSASRTRLHAGLR